MKIAFLAPVSLVVALLIAAERPVAQALMGVLLPIEELTIEAPIEGRLMSIDVLKGMQIEAGTRIAEFDKSIQAARVALAESEAERTARLQLTRAERKRVFDKFERVQAALGRNAATQWEMNEARNNLAQAEARVQQAQEDKEIAERKLALETTILAQHDVIAPFDATIVDVQTVEGAYLTRRTAIASLAKLDHLKAVFNVPKELVPHLALDSMHRLQANGDDFAGEVHYLSPILDTASNTLRVEFVIDNSDMQLRAGEEVALDPFAAIMPAAGASRQ